MQCCAKSIKAKLHKIFSDAMLPGASRTYCLGIWSVQCCPKSIRNTLHRTFSCEILSRVSQRTSDRYLNLFNVVPRVLRQFRWRFFLMEFCLEPRVFCTRIFLMLWCLELLRQHYVEFRPVQFCFRSIKTKLHRVCFMQCCLKDLGQHCAGLSQCIVV